MYLQAHYGNGVFGNVYLSTVQLLFILSSESWARQAQREVVKIKKSWFFLLGLKYNLRTWFESKKVRHSFFNILSSDTQVLVILNDFKAISRTASFCFGEINKSWFWVLSKKLFFYLFFSSFENVFVLQKVRKKYTNRGL